MQQPYCLASETRARRHRARSRAARRRPHRSTGPNGPLKNSAGRINWPVSLAGTNVNPGDLIVGDADGLLCIPFDEVESVLAATRKKMELEKKMLADIAAGTLDTSWIDVTLARIGCNTEPR